MDKTTDFSLRGNQWQRILKRHRGQKVNGGGQDGVKDEQKCHAILNWKFKVKWVINGCTHFYILHFLYTTSLNYAVHLLIAVSLIVNVLNTLHHICTYMINLSLHLLIHHDFFPVGKSGWLIQQNSFIMSGYRSWSFPLSTTWWSLFWGTKMQIIRYHISKHVTCNHLTSYWFCFFRTCFNSIALSYLPLWLTLDYLSDFMYMLDMVITVHTGKYFY